MAELNAHSDRMVLVFNCKVKNADDFKAWSKDRAAKYVYECKEENTISYEWHISDDGSEATLIETFIDSDSMMVRLGNHGASPIAAEVMEQVEITGVLCLGNAKQDAREALSAWGAIFHAHHAGFHKSNQAAYLTNGMIDQPINTNTPLSRSSLNLSHAGNQTHPE